KRFARSIFQAIIPREKYVPEQVNLSIFIKFYMKKFFLVFITLSFIIVCNAQTSTETIIKEACKEAGTQNKKAFIIFHASWCVWCHKLDSCINDPSCKKFFSDNYVIKHVTAFETGDKKNLNNPGSSEFLAAHHAADQGIPAWFIFDSSKNLLADSQLRPHSNDFNVEGSNIGCPANETEIKYFISVLEKTSHITDEEKSAIMKRFSKNHLTSE
ncbi:MAG: thioredoxin family protein, partial [Parafilimonas sp.]